MVKFPTRLEEFFPAAAMGKVLDILQQPGISNKVREAMGKVGLHQETNPLAQVQEAWYRARSWLETLGGSGTSPTSTRLLNATGQLFANELQHLPISPSVAYGYAAAATSFQQTATLDAKGNATIEKLFDGAAGVWINSGWGALQLLQTTAKQGVVMARADLIRIRGFGDVRAMLQSGQRPIVEIGAANGASQSDWDDAITSAEQMVLLVSPNGLTSSQSAQQRRWAIAAAGRVGAQVVELLCDGVVSQSLSSVMSCPLVKQRVADADLVLVPLNFLLSGPEGVVAIGTAELVQRLRNQARNVSVAMSAPQLAASELALQLADLSMDSELGVAKHLLASSENMRNRASRLAIQLDGLKSIQSAKEFERTVALGPSPWDRYQLTNWAVRLQCDGDPDALRQSWLNPSTKEETPPAMLATMDEGDLVIDLRFIAPEDDHNIILACGGASPAAEAESDETAQQNQ